MEVISSRRYLNLSLDSSLLSAVTVRSELSEDSMEAQTHNILTHCESGIGPNREVGAVGRPERGESINVKIQVPRFIKSRDIAGVAALRCSI